MRTRTARRSTAWLLWLPFLLFGTGDGFAVHICSAHGPEAPGAPVPDEGDDGSCRAHSDPSGGGNHEPSGGHDAHGEHDPDGEHEAHGAHDAHEDHEGPCTCVTSCQAGSGDPELPEGSEWVLVSGEHASHPPQGFEVARLPLHLRGFLPPAIGPPEPPVRADS